jgi:hypothetical protein
VPPYSDFFRDIDAAWRPSSAGRIALRIIGSTALMMQVKYDRGTKDADVLETASVDAAVRSQLLAIAGPGTPLHTRHRVYVDIVSSGTPFLPQPPLFHPCAALNDNLEHFDVELLDVVDVVVSKLKRFNADDQADIDAMVERGEIIHDRLIARFRSAAEHFRHDARADDLEAYVRRLHQVERDAYEREPTPRHELGVDELGPP